MNTFLDLNNGKLKGIFVRTSQVLLMFVAVILVIAYFANGLPDGQLLLMILMVAGIGMPLFIMLIGYLHWVVDHKARIKAFAASPFDQIERIGFHDSYSDTGSKWSFTKWMKAGSINGHSLRMDISKERSHVIEFEIVAKWRSLDRTEYERLSKRFKAYDMEFRVSSIVKLYDVKRTAHLSLSELQQGLEHFIYILEQDDLIQRS